jgi:hypothetical protein
LIAFAVVAFPAATASFIRAFSIGWKPIMTAHAVIACILCISAIFRHSIPYNVRVIIIIGFFYVIGIGGLLQFGLIAGALPLLIITPSLATIFFSARTGVGVFSLVSGH